MQGFKILIFVISIFCFTGCAFMKAKVNGGDDEMAWNKLFDNKNWEPVNKESSKKEIL